MFTSSSAPPISKIFFLLSSVPWDGSGHRNGNGSPKMYFNLIYIDSSFHGRNNKTINHNPTEKWRNKPKVTVQKRNKQLDLVAAVSFTMQLHSHQFIVGNGELEDSTELQCCHMGTQDAHDPISMTINVFYTFIIQ